MNAWQPIAPDPEQDPGPEDKLRAPSPFMLSNPPAGVIGIPLIFASPHSGRIYPAQMMAASQLDAASIRGSEDAFVDRLIGGAPRYGITVITASLARAYLDVNREAWELDPSMFEDELPAYARGRGARIAAGLGSIARIVCEGREIYARKLSFAEAQGRVEAVHRPYHATLSDLIRRARSAHGAAVLVDWHSMPSAAAKIAGGKTCDIVLGDRYGGACAPALSRLVERELEAMGYAVARNTPYAGGYTTEHYGRPGRKVHALQIEVNRGLYLDENALTPTDGFDVLKADLERLFQTLAAGDLARL